MKYRYQAAHRPLALTSVALAVLALVNQAQAQEAAAPAKDNQVQTVTVSGFRASLQSSIAAKKQSDTIVDVIKAEDIGKLPDNNLSEAMQRIPGVAIDRDAGEGRTITVRGLSGLFVRTGLNNMEALATTGGKDSSGGANRDRGFDFNVFAAELFSQIKVSKASSAEIDEGSLGSSVELTTPRPFDYKGFNLAGSVTGQYNDLSKKKNHRETFLISNRSADKRFGYLLSAAYSTNDKVEEGPSTGRWENGSLSTAAGAPSGASSALRFKSYSTDGGKTFIPITPSPASTTAAAGNLSDLSGEALNITKALHPRIPRYGHLDYDVSRLGLTTSLQFRPVQDTLLTLDGLHSDYKANRNEKYLEVISLSRSGAGNPQTSIYNYNINNAGEIYKASFNNVDVRSEYRHDELSSKFNQLNLSLDQRINDRLKLNVFTGKSKSSQLNPEQTTLTLDAYDVQGYSYDYTKPLAPVFNYGTLNGCTVNQACYWQISSSTAKGDASLVRIRPNRTDNTFTNHKIDLAYDLTDHETLKVGYSYKKFLFNTIDQRLVSENIPANAAAYLNANLASYVMPQTMGTGNGSVTWMIPNFNAIKSAINFGCNCVVPAFTGTGFPTTTNDFTVSSTVSAARANNQDANEKDQAFYTQLDFNRDFFGINFRGNFGVRYVKTQQATGSTLQKPASGGVTPPPVYVVATQSYNDVLPSLNINAEPIKDVLVRFGTSKVMARPSLTMLNPAGSINLTSLTYSGGNPTLEPYRGTTYDLNLEWYKNKDTLISAGYFYKNMKTYVQKTAHTAPFSSLGLDPSITAGTAITGDTPFSVTNWVNTPGGIIRGYELNLNQSFSFLPGALSNTGVAVNYTHVASKMKYYLTTTTTTPTEYDLLNMSPKSANLTVYYDDKKLSARVTTAYRSKYTYQLLPGSNSDFQGKNHTTNIDAQISYNITENLTATFQAVNLTDQYDDRFNAYNTAFGNVDSNVPSEAMHTGRSYYVGLRYKY